MFRNRLVEGRCDAHLAMVSVESVGARIGAYDRNETLGRYVIYYNVPSQLSVSLRRVEGGVEGGLHGPPSVKPSLAMR
jgi:hypothetical protein